MRYAALILILLAGVISADESKDGNSYLCIPDRATGFEFSGATKSWEQTKFRVGDDKYIVRPITSDDDERHGPYFRVLDQPYGVWKMGDDFPVALCTEGILESNWLHCGVKTNKQFVLNARSNRFIFTYHGDYFIATFETVKDEDGRYKKDEDGDLLYRTVEDEGGNTPFMEIGKCSKL